MKLTKSFSFLVLLSSFLSCATLNEWSRLEAAKYCSYDGAYALGMNEARSEKPMRVGIAEYCDEAVKQEVQRGYREGYTAGGQNRPIKINLSAQKPECHQKYGQTTCGYNCIEHMGDWHCARSPDEICLARYGTVKCGKNCKERFGNIECD